MVLMVWSLSEILRREGGGKVADDEAPVPLPGLSEASLPREALQNLTTD